MELLTLAYTATGIVFGIAFIPQIRTLLRDQSGAEALNLSTWGLFTLCNLITFLYALINVHDPYFIFCSAICLIGNTMVFSLGCAKKAVVHSAIRIGK